MILQPTSQVLTPYKSPPSGISQVKLHATREVNAFAIEKQYVAAFKAKGNHPFCGASDTLELNHKFIVRLPEGAEWVLVVENQWSSKVEVVLSVSEMLEKYL